MQLMAGVGTNHPTIKLKKTYTQGRTHSSNVETSQQLKLRQQMHTALDLGVDH